MVLLPPSVNLYCGQNAATKNKLLILLVALFVSVAKFSPSTVRNRRSNLNLSLDHDALVFEVRADVLEKAKQGIRAHMTGVAQLAVPLLVDIGVGDNWGEAH